TGGVINVPKDVTPKVSRWGIRLHRSNHPLPSNTGMKGVEAMLSLVGTPSREDLIICLLSGGASSMMPLPVQGLDLRDKAEVTRLALAMGASIGETTIVRRHLSPIKGASLADLLCPARILTLILSDVIDNKLQDIGSGPTAPDSSKYVDARRVLEKHEAWK